VSEARVKRLRIFAGPNGSGKSSLFNYLVKVHAFNLYYHINADDIARDISLGCDMDAWPIRFSFDELRAWLDNSTFQNLARYKFSDVIILNEKSLSLKEQSLSDVSYLCAALAEFIRKKMLGSGSSFSYETVFSHPSKLQELIAAQKAGYHVYLYIIGTEDANINVERIRNRVHNGGHPVPEDKTRGRYERTMSNLKEALHLADRVYFFDNSGTSDTPAYQYFAEKREGRLRVTGTTVPHWFELIFTPSSRG
jgi:predicted ABC-type ATPase